MEVTVPLFKAYTSDAGYDIVSTEDYVFQEFGDAHLFSTGLKIALPEGTYGRVASRSGLATKGIEVGAGVIDAGYRSEVKVLLRCLTKNVPFTITKGMKIAQLIVTPIWNGPVKVVSELKSMTDRGLNGFGSSGL